MRLSDIVLARIIQVVTHHLSKSQAELRLYGSRVDDSQRGGDIDLLIVLSQEKTTAQRLHLKLDILIDLKKSIGDQKIDLSVVNKDQVHKEPFLKMVYKDSVLIKAW